MEILKRSFELFKPRDKNEKIHLEEFKEYFEQEVPPVYKAFISNFDVTEQEWINGHNVLPENWERSTSIGDFMYLNDDNILVYNFFSLEKSIKANENLKKNSSNSFYIDNQHRFVPIASCAFGMVLLLGLSGEYGDKIYTEDGTDDEPKCVANDIFEFISGFALLESDVIAPGVKEYSKLYMNWGEDFWRIKK